MTGHQQVNIEFEKLKKKSKVMAKRFLKFHETLQKSQKQCVRFLSELSTGNMRTVYGKNLWSIRRQSSCEVSSRNIMKVMKYAPIPMKTNGKYRLWRSYLKLSGRPESLRTLTRTMMKLMKCWGLFAPPDYPWLALGYHGP